jgi:putative aldouronate transport system permease protein
MALPAIVMVILFNYLPMFGLVMGFENYKPKTGIFGSDFIGLENFIDFFRSIYFGRVVSNTLILSFLQILIEFPAAIIFALLLNEVRGKWFKGTVQTISYMPNFISMIVISGIIIDFCSSKGVLTMFLSHFTGSTQNLLSNPNNWRPIYIVSDLWQGLGMSSIIYIAALAGIDQELYEAAAIDGANRWKQTIHITLTGLMPTIIIMFIMRIGMMMSVGSEKTILLYNPQVYQKADIISSYVYREGLVNFNYGYSTAVSLFNSMINFALLLVTNHISKKASETSLF